MRAMLPRAFPPTRNLAARRFPNSTAPKSAILCDHYNYWIYYRVQKRMIEILSVRHTLMNIRTPKQL